jgi:hypothetical protein
VSIIFIDEDILFGMPSGWRCCRCGYRAGHICGRVGMKEESRRRGSRDPRRRRAIRET